MPSLTKKVRETNKYLNSARDSVMKALQADLPDMYIKYMSGDINITPLSPIGDKLRFILEYQVTPDNRKKETP